jgi:hypothetical protein
MTVRRGFWRPAALAAMLLLVAGPAAAIGLFDPQVQFTNLTVVARDARSATIRFDVTWESSWRQEYSHDAAWVFFKVRAQEGDEWQHVRLAADRVQNPTGYTQAPALPALAPREGHLLFHRPGRPDDGKAGKTERTRDFFDRPAFDTRLEFLVPDGADGFTGVFLQRSANGSGNVVARGVTVVWDLSAAKGIADPAKARICAFGVEMVYVAEGAFCLGTGGEEPYAFFRYSDEHLQPLPYRVSGPGAIPTGRKAGALWARGGALPEDGGEISATFPNGYAPFYCMKQHITPRRYAEFLRMLTPAQSEQRYPVDEGKTSWQVKRAGTAPNYTYTWSPGGARAGAGMHRLRWADGAAWAAWCGLRPMSELELEKVVRGPREPLPGECGPSYWGAMAFETIQWNMIKGLETGGERAVTVGHPVGRAFKGSHGQGTLALPPDWPQDDAAGAGFRCIGLDQAPASDRSLAATVDPGFVCKFRAVRSLSRGK